MSTLWELVDSDDDKSTYRMPVHQGWLVLVRSNIKDYSLTMTFVADPTQTTNCFA